MVNVSSRLGAAASKRDRPHEIGQAALALPEFASKARRLQSSEPGQSRPARPRETQARSASRGWGTGCAGAPQMHAAIVLPRRPEWRAVRRGSQQSQKAQGANEDRDLHHPAKSAPTRDRAPVKWAFAILTQKSGQHGALRVNGLNDGIFSAGARKGAIRNRGRAYKGRIATNASQRSNDCPSSGRTTSASPVFAAKAFMASSSP